MIGKKTFVEKVANAINNNEIALFVAAGLSASTGQKNWAQMLTPCANALELEINENSDLYMIAQYYENEYGTFLKFDTLTYVPIDLELIDKSYLSDIDIQRLNDYHKAVYENLSPFMNDDERKKLKEATRSI